MKEFKGLVANNKTEEKILELASLANIISKDLEIMRELLSIIGETRTWCISDSVEVSEDFKDLLVSFRLIELKMEIDNGK